jgi:Zn-dependent protease
VDRPRVVDEDARYAPEPPELPDPTPGEHGERGYEPIRPRWGVGDVLRKLVAPIVALGFLIVKFGGVLFKGLTVFAAVGGYALLWGWAFGVGLVALILVHELGHYVEAKRVGFNPALPVFIPFLGAYVALRDMPFDPWRISRVTIAGPLVGGAGALALLAAGEAVDSDLLRALAYTGFLLNLLNLIPIGILDGGRLYESWKVLRAGGGAATPQRAKLLGVRVAVLSLGTALALAAGMFLAHVPQDRV